MHVHELGAFPAHIPHLCPAMVPSRIALRDVQTCIWIVCKMCVTHPMAYKRYMAQLLSAP